jgi:hypothetical protein
VVSDEEERGRVKLVRIVSLNEILTGAKGFSWLKIVKM